MTEEKEEIIKEIKATEKTRKSEAKRIQETVLKYKKWHKTKYETTPFQEPVLELLRNTGEIELYEKATAGKFTYTHSDGKERFIILNPRDQYKTGYAERKYKKYICHEDYPTPLPTRPLITTEEMVILEEKTLNDVKKLQAALETATGKKWLQFGKTVAIIIGIIALAYIAINMFVPGGTTTMVQQIPNPIP